MPAKKPLFDRVMDSLTPYFKDAASTAAAKVVLDEAAATAATEVATDGALHVHLEAGAGGAGTMTRDEAAHTRITALEALVKDGNAEILKRLDGIAVDAAAKKSTDSEANKEIEDDLKEEAPKGTEDKAVVAADSSFLVDSFKHTVAGAEILCPGIQVASLDRAATPKATLDSITSMRRTALTAAYATADGKALIESVTGGKPLALDGMKIGDVRTLFNSAVAVKKVANNMAAAARTTDVGGVQVSKVGTITTPAQMNAANRKRYEKPAAQA